MRSLRVTYAQSAGRPLSIACSRGRGTVLSELLPRLQTQHAIREPEHEADHEQRVDQRLKLLKRVKHLETDREQECAGNRPGDVVQPAQEAKEHRGDGVVHRIRRGVDILLEGGKKRAAYAANETADGKRNDTVL